jgi:hypothetical protein
VTERVLLIVFLAAVWSILPILLLRYCLVVLPRRIEEIRVLFSNGNSIKTYVRLFLPSELHTEGEQTWRQELTHQQFWRVHSPRQYILAFGPLGIVTAILLFGLYLWAEGQLKYQAGALPGATPQILMALAGGYVWSVYEALSRMRSKDLTPDELHEMTIRLVSSIPIGYAVSLLAVEQIRPFFAFAASAFPLRDVKLMLRARVLKRLDQDSGARASRSMEGHLGQTVQGISDEALARLEELGIITYVDLAYADPVRLMARTGFGLRQLLTWIDQALLAVYVTEKKAAFVNSGIPCALDACEFFETHCYDRDTRDYWSVSDDETIQRLASNLEMPVELLPELLHRIYWDPHVRLMADLWPSEQVRPYPPPHLLMIRVGTAT